MEKEIWIIEDDQDWREIFTEDLRDYFKIKFFWDLNDAKDNLVKRIDEKQKIPLNYISDFYIEGDLEEFYKIIKKENSSSNLYIFSGANKTDLEIFSEKTKIPYEDIFQKRDSWDLINKLIDVSKKC